MTRPWRAKPAFDAARRAGDTAGEAHALLLLALGDARAGRRDDALPRFHEALRLLETIGGYHSSRVTVHSSLGWIAEQQGRYADMLSHRMRALKLSRAAGDRLLEVTGDLGAARWAWTQALRTFEEMDHPDGDRVRAKLCVPGGLLPAVI